MTSRDLANAVSTVSKVCEHPGVTQKKAVVKILQYVRRTADAGITYGSQGRGMEMVAYATCCDTRRSVSSGAVMLRGGAISWQSRSQEVAASGRSEAEYVALAEIVKEVLFLRQVRAFILPLLLNSPIILHEYNQGAIKMVKIKFSRKRTRLIDVEHHVVRDAETTGKISVTYVRTEDPHADVLTKAFEKHMKFLINAA